MKENLHQIGIVLFALLVVALAAAVVWYIRKERNSSGHA
jgi:hypothetical protein